MSLFLGKIFYADCGSKLHFCAAKALNPIRNFTDVPTIKVDEMNAKYILSGNIVLEKIVLEAINNLADFVRCYEPVFSYRMAQKNVISKRSETAKLKSVVEGGRKRIKDLNTLSRTKTLVNTLIQRIEVHNNDKSSGHCYVKVDIFFTAIGLIDIPTEDEIEALMVKLKENPQEYTISLSKNILTGGHFRRWFLPS